MGMLVKISELRELDVVSMWDGRRMGPIVDIEIDLDAGVVKALVLPEEAGGGLSGFFKRSKDIVIPWDWIYRIGTDVILIESRQGASPPE
jgi:YlmC/YmxH family sporulation protein